MIQCTRLNLPLFLTLFRLSFAPLLLPFFIVWLVPLNNFFLTLCLAILFVVFGITDFLDGYLARKYHQETPLGTLLDPLADKFFMFSTLIALVAVQKIYFYWVIIIAGREFFIMGLREVALTSQRSIPVSRWGKIKTAVQMLLCMILILEPLTGGVGWYWLKNIIITSALFLTIFSAVMYYYYFIALQKES
jgi:CDP-diacylglycerol--glycerol-3-phosphate 3-phosphatidyltransferase